MAPKRSIKGEISDKAKKKAKATKTSSSTDSTKDEDRPLVIKCKTTFKKKVVERALEKEEDRDSEDDRSEDPTVKYFIKYSVSKDLLTVGDVEVIVDETEKILRCTKCSYANKTKWEKDKRTDAELRKMEYGIRNHIIGQHLGGFPCDQCKPVPVFYKSLSEHRKHLSEAHDETRKELEERIRTETAGPAVKLPDDDDAEEDFWPDGRKRMRRPWKCSFGNCGKRFFQIQKWISHEKNVHGARRDEDGGTETQQQKPSATSSSDTFDFSCF